MNKGRSSGRPKATRGASHPKDHPAARRSGRRRWLFRVISVALLPLVILACLEVGLRLGGYGYPTGFFLHRESSGQRVLTENPKFGWRFFGPALARTPRTMMIPEVKTPGTCRIFIFGESAAYGDPNPDFGLPRVLETLLRERFPQTKFEVINAAMTGINSHVILPIARDCARQNGDIWVIYMGNNEVVGPFGSGTVFGPQAPGMLLIRASLALKATRTGELLGDIITRLAGSRNKASQWGMALFLGHKVRYDDPRMSTVYSHFASNLTDILNLGRAQGARIIVSTVLSNLKDCPPFASPHRPGLNESELKRWEQFYTDACQEEQAGKTAEAIEQFRLAAAIDDQFAELQFRWGRCCLLLDQEDEARGHYVQARDDDTLRFRADTGLNALIRTAATGREQEGIVLADSEQVLAHESPHGLPGSEFLFEHVHLNFEGNYRLARTIADQVVKLLPEPIARQSKVDRGWAPLSECARRLAWTDWDRYKTLKLLLLRLNEPPFNSQLDCVPRYQHLQQEIEQLLPSINPAALQQIAEQYRRALALSPQDWILQRNLADLQLKLGDLAGAEASFRRGTELLPFDPMAHLQFGSLEVQAGQPEAATQQFHIALNLDPDWVPALNGLALAFIRQGKQPEAISLFEKALKLQPDSADTHLNLGTALEAAGQKPEAQQQFRQALNGNLTTSDSLVRVGKLSLSQGWVEEAITNFTRALRLNPTDAAVHYYLGSALDSAGRGVEAQQQFTEALRLNPEHAGAHLGLGIEWRKQGHDADALDQFAEAARLNPRLLEARMALGIALLKEQRNSEARREFEAVLQIDPKSALAQKYLRAIPN
jgi:tetratricopeptide (TPR) repeat protein